MFDSLFKNVEETPDKPTGILEDVQWILAHTHYGLLSTAWDECLHILRIDPRYDEDDSSRNLYGRMSYPWYALKKLEDFKGDFTQFPLRKIHLLYALIDGYEIYDEALHVLIDHHNDEREAKLLFATHPKLHQWLPQQYDNARQVLEVLAETVRMFRWELERFSEKHSEMVDAAIKDIVKREYKAK